MTYSVQKSLDVTETRIYPRIGVDPKSRNYKSAAFITDAAILVASFFVGGGEANVVTKGGIRLSAKGLSLVESHLATFEADAGNAAMMGRLRSAFASGSRVTGADANFYLHEASEATMMARGMSQSAAHTAAFEKYGVSPFSVYHPEVIRANPEIFGTRVQKLLGNWPMKEFNLGKHRKARVWLNELPDISHSSGVAQEIIMPTTEPSMQTKKAAVEVFVPLGPRSMYGLLGGEFESSTVGELEVTIVSSAANGKSLFTSLAGASDEVHVGLPKEYYEAVKEGIRLTQKEGTTLSGELVINYAAHGEIGSCPAVFKTFSSRAREAVRHART